MKSFNLSGSPLEISGFGGFGSLAEKVEGDTDRFRLLMRFSDKSVMIVKSCCWNPAESGGLVWSPGLGLSTSLWFWVEPLESPWGWAEPLGLFWAWLPPQVSTGIMNDSLEGKSDSTLR